MTICLFSNQKVSTLFNMRNSMTQHIKNNFSSIFQGDMQCKLKCQPDVIDCQSHLLKCPRVLGQFEPAELETIKVTSLAAWSSRGW